MQKSLQTKMIQLFSKKDGLKSQLSAVKGAEGEAGLSTQEQFDAQERQINAIMTKYEAAKDKL